MASAADQRWSIFALVRLVGYGFGVTALVFALDTVILPTRVLEIAPESLKNSYLAVLGVGGLFLAGFTQVAIGRISDRARSPMGRRVPYLLWGAAFGSLGLLGVGLVPGFLGLLGVWLFIQTNVNIGYGPYQALIRDLVPRNRVATASSIKILSDAAGGVVFIKISGDLVGRYSGSDSSSFLWLALALLAINLILATGVTSLTVRARETSAVISRGATNLPRLRVSGLHPQLTRFLVSRFLMIGAIAILQTYGLFFLRDVVELENPAKALGNMILAVGGALALTVYPAGRLSDRVGRKPVVLAGAVGAAIGGIAMLSATDQTQVLIIASVIGASVGAMLSAHWAMANDMSTPGREATHRDGYHGHRRRSGIRQSPGSGSRLAQPPIIGRRVPGPIGGLRRPVYAGFLGADATEGRGCRHRIFRGAPLVLLRAPANSISGLPMRDSLLFTAALSLLE